MNNSEFKTSFIKGKQLIRLISQFVNREKP